MNYRSSLILIPLVVLLCVPIMGPMQADGLEATLPIEKNVTLGYTPISPIVITHNDNFTEQGFTGSGTEVDPYKLEGYSFENDGVGINITDTTAYFEIVACTFTSLSSQVGDGIRLENITHATIDDCEFDDLNFPIRVWEASDMEITDIISTNSDLDIRLRYCEDLLVRNITAHDNGGGIVIDNGEDVLVEDCTTYNHDESGLTLRAITNATVRGCTLSEKDLSGLNVAESEDCILEDNVILESSTGLSISDCVNITVRRNSIHHNKYTGFSLSSSDNCTIYENMIYKNLSPNHYGIFVMSSTTNKDYMSNNNTFYSNIIGWQAKSAKDQSNTTSWDNGIHGNLWSDYTGSGVYEIDGEGERVDNFPSVLLPAHIDDSPDDISYKYLTTGNSVSWDFESDYPASFEVFRDDVSISSGAWDGSSIEVNVDGLSIDEYNLTAVTEDMFGNTATDEVTVIVLENEVPTILSISYLTTISGEPIVFQANVTDPSGIASVILMYSTDSISWTNVSMTLQESGIWQANLPAQEPDTEITFKVYAEDNVGNSLMSSEDTLIVTAPPFPMVLIAGVGIAAIAAVLALVMKRR